MVGDTFTALVVDASPSAVREFAAALEAAGALVVTAGSVIEAVQVSMERTIDLAVVGFELPTESGLAVLQHLRSTSELPVVMVAQTGAIAPRLEAFTRGADDFVVKPVAPEELVARCLRLRAKAVRVAALQADNRRLLELSTNDGLTQIANHRAFQERLRDEFRRAQRYDDPLALILIDLDHFKQVNDQHGHQVGDDVLRAFAGTMRGAVRETDFIARYGGEEFAAILPKTHLAGALTVAERICADLRSLKVGPAQVRVTASVGVSSFPGRQVNTSDQLITTADEALYRSKREGRNRISLYQSTPTAAANP
jgi:two-component system, cell cycle response regulator